MHATIIPGNNSMRQYIILLLLTSMLALLTTSCKKDPTEPVLPEAGRRDYTWTVDTLDPGPGNISLTERIYGESPDEIWAVGESGGTTGLWHYDGKKWETEEKSGIFGVISILGFSKKDIWICGKNSFWHYTGLKWERYRNVMPTGYDNIYFLSMAGTGSNDIYAVGVTFEKDGVTPKSSVAHFNGTEWKIIEINNIPVITFVEIKREKATGKYFILSHSTSGNKPLFRIFLLQGNSVKEVFSNTKTTTINCINDECYFASGEKIYKFRDGRMQLWEDISGMNYAGYLWGRSEADIFTVNYGALGHYNGRDVVDIFKTDLWPRYGVLFEKEVFFCCIHPERNISYIIHGKLK